MEPAPKDLNEENISLSRRIGTLKQMLLDQSKRIDEIQAYGANIAKEATNLKNFINDILPTLELPPPFGQAVEQTDSQPAPGKRQPLKDVYLSPNELIQLRRQQNVNDGTVEHGE